jgi:hypothetical protein
METDENTGHYVKRVILPSGKAIEVVYFDRTGGEGLPAAEAAEAEPAFGNVEAQVAPDAGELEELHVCKGCDSDLVYPIEWEEAGPESWTVSRRCPNCEWTDTGVFKQETVDLFDEVLDVGTEALTKDLRRLMRANMADEIDLFVKALDADAILPEDF